MQNIIFFLFPIALVRSQAWTCDELLGNALCELTVVEDSVKVKGEDLVYWVYQKSDPEPGPDSGLPVILIHGGPGLSHDYMLPLKQAACSGRKMIFYDQVGTGRSTICPPVAEGENPNSCIVDKEHEYLLTVEYYPQEVQALVDALDLQSSGYHVFGHSWGSMVAELFAAESPPGLVSLVLGGGLASMKEYIAGQWDPVEGSLGTLPRVMQDTIKQCEGAEDFQNKTYLSIVENMAAQFYVRTFPPPDCHTHSHTVLNADLYVRMVGQTEYSVCPDSVLAGVNLTTELNRITVPVLLVNGRHDVMRGPNIRSMAAELADVEVLILERAAHMTMIDQPREINSALVHWWESKETGQNVDVEQDL